MLCLLALYVFAHVALRIQFSECSKKYLFRVFQYGYLSDGPVYRQYVCLI